MLFVIEVLNPLNRGISDIIGCSNDCVRLLWESKFDVEFPAVYILDSFREVKALPEEERTKGFHLCSLKCSISASRLSWTYKSWKFYASSLSQVIIYLVHMNELGLVAIEL